MTAPPHPPSRPGSRAERPRGPQPPARDDRGAATVFFAITVTGFLVLVGLVVDGGAQVRGIERADSLAAEAARVAGQAVDLPAVMAGRPAGVDPVRARAAATAYLTANGATGTVAIGPDGRTVTVRTALRRPTVFLGLLGLAEFTAHGEATATLLRNQNGQPPP